MTRSDAQKRTWGLRCRQCQNSQLLCGPLAELDKPEGRHPQQSRIRRERKHYLHRTFQVPVLNHMKIEVAL